MTSGGKYINSGTYGCIFKPVVPCKNKPLKAKYGVSIKDGVSVRDGVSKVFRDRESMQSELDKYNQLIKKIDPRGLYTIKLLQPTSCAIDDTKIAKADKSKCQHTYTTTQPLHQLIYAYGGIDVHKWSKSKSDGYTFEKLMNGLEPILKGLVALQKHKVVHQDIKPENIMYYRKQLRLADFGLVAKFSEVYDRDYGFLSYPYPYFPPEYKLYCKLEQGSSYAVDEFLYDMRTSMYVIGNIDHWYDDLTALHDKHMDNRSRKRYTQKYFTKHYASKIDTWGLGITLYSLLPPPRQRSHHIQAFIDELLTHMIAIDPMHRFDAKKTFAAYKKWYKK